MSLHTSTAVAPRRPRLGLIAAPSPIIGAATVAIADQQLASEPDATADRAKRPPPATSTSKPIRPSACASSAATSPSSARTAPPSRYDDIEANRAKSQGAR